MTANELFIFRTLQKAQETDFININCVDPLGRSALLMAIDNENLEMVELLIEHKVETKDALLHAISEEFVEAVEVLLDHEKTIHQPGEPHVSFFWCFFFLYFIPNLKFEFDWSCKWSFREVHIL